MKVVSDFHPPSSVSCSVKCTLTDGFEHLVVAKTNRVEVYSLRPEGLHSECELEIWGRIIALRNLPKDSSELSNLLLMTDHPSPSLIVLEPQTTASGNLQLVAHKAISLHDRSARHAEFYNDVIVDRAGQIAVASSYSGKLKIVRFRDGKHVQNFDAIVPELNILNLCFVPTPDDEPVLGILHRDYQLRTQLLSRDLSLKNQELTPSDRLAPTLLSASSFPVVETPPVLIPLLPTDADPSRPFGGGVLVAGGRKLLLYEAAKGAERATQAAKQRRTEKKKQSVDPMEARKAHEKEKERERKKLKPTTSVDWPWGEVTAWCEVDEEGTKFLIGDAYGRLAMLVFDPSDRGKLFIMPLGEMSPPTSLTYLTNQVIYVGSHYGDAQLLRLNQGPVKNVGTPTLPIPPGIATAPLSSFAKGKARAEDTDMDDDDDDDKRARGQIIKTEGSYVEVLETFQNIAPISDAALVDTDGSGQPQITTCSGGQSSGALKVIRKGAEFEELALVEGLSDVVGIWPLRARFADKQDRHLIVSTQDKTHVFTLDDVEGLSPLADSSSFATTRRTLAALNMKKRKGAEYLDSGLVVQVTDAEVIVLDYDETLGTHAIVDRWTPGQDGGVQGSQIVGASMSPSQVALALTGGILLLCNLDDKRNDKFFVARRRLVFSDSGISAISCTPLDPSKNFTTYIAAASWATNVVEILQLTREGTFTTICRTEPMSALPRSLLLYNFGRGTSSRKEDHHPHLLVGLADGTLVSYAFEGKALKDRRVTSLGTTPVTLVPTEVDDRPAVCACGTRASFFYFNQGRVQSSPILANGVATAARVNSSAFPSSIVMAIPTAIVFGKFGNLDKTHVRSIELGYDTPRNIGHLPSVRAFGVTCTRVTPTRVGDAPRMVTSVLKLLDDISYQVLDQFSCTVGDEFTAIAPVAVDCQECPPTVLCAGTVSYAVEEPSDGQLLVFDVHSSGDAKRRLVLMASADVAGCIYAIVSLKGMIAIAKDTSVILFRLEKQEEVPGHQLTKISEFNHNYFVTSLAAFPSGDRLAAGDAISSVSVLKLEGNNRLSSLPREFNSLWPVSLQVLDDSGVVGANSDCNLFSYKLGRSLENDGFYYLDDFANRFIPGALSPSSGDDRLVPKQLFFTASGRIGVISVVTNTDLALQLTSLQRNLAYVRKGAGAIDHATWRAPANSRGRSDAQPTATGFIDGDFLEKWLLYDESSPEVARIREGSNDAERLNIPDEEIRAVLESLQGIH